MRTVDGPRYGYPDGMTESEWSNYVSGHDPDDATRGASPAPSRDFDLANVTVFAGRFRAGRGLTSGQAVAVDNLRAVLDSQDRRLLDAVFGGAS